MSTNEIVVELTSDNYYENNIATFQMDEQYLTAKMFYKAQIAFISRNGIVGYFSEVGIFKYTVNNNSINIQNLSPNGVFDALEEYIGNFMHPLDETEKVYSYCFELLDADNNIIETSGVQLHNSSLDVSATESQDIWIPITPLKE